MAKYGVFSVPDAKRIAAATKRVEGSPGTFVRVPERVSRLQRVATDSCPEVHEVTTSGSPSSGTATLTYVINSVSDTVTINYDDTAAEVLTAMETHSQVTAGDVVCFGGPLPSVAVYIKFAGNLANTVVDLPSISDSITGGDVRMRKAASYRWGAA